MNPSSTQRTRLNIIIDLAHFDFERAAEALNQMNCNVVEYELRDINDDDMVERFFHTIPPELKIVKWLHFELMKDKNGIHVNCEPRSTFWVYPDEDLVLPYTTIRAKK